MQKFLVSQVSHTVIARNPSPDSRLPPPSKKFNINAIIVPQVTWPASTPDHSQVRLEAYIQLTDPDYDKPGWVDILLGVETFVEVICHGWRLGSRSSPTALETELGWVLAGNTVDPSTVMSILTGDDILRQFWGLEEKIVANGTLTMEERSVLYHFHSKHSCSPEGRFIAPLPKRSTIGWIPIPSGPSISTCEESTRQSRESHGRILR